MNRGQDVVTKSERAKRLEQRLNEAEEERMILRKEIDELNTTDKVLKERLCLNSYVSCKRNSLIHLD